MKKQRLKNSEAGNVLFLILIAVALFAALSFAVVSSSRSTKSNEEESNTLKTSDIVNFAAFVTNGVTFTYTNGCNSSQISFERAPFDGSDPLYVNPNAPSDMECHVFHPLGGKSIYRTFPDFNNNADILFTGHFDIDGIGSDEPDIVMVVPNVTSGMCAKLNQRLDVDYDGGIPQENTFLADVTANPFVGTYSATAVDMDCDDGGGISCTRQHSACVQGNGGAYHFYHVVLLR